MNRYSICDSWGVYGSTCGQGDYLFFFNRPEPTVQYDLTRQVKCEHCGTKHDERTKQGDLIQNCVNCGSPLPIYEEEWEDEEEDEQDETPVKPTTGILGWLKGKIHGED